MHVRQKSAFLVIVVSSLAAGLGTNATTAPPPVPLARCSPPAAQPGPGAQTAVKAAVTPIGQVRHFDKANLTVSAGVASDGSVEIEATSPTLGFRKRVQPNGRYTVDLQTGRDKVTLGVTETSISVTRGKRTVTLGADAPQSHFDELRKLLADSRAIDHLRSAGAELEASDEDSAASTPIVLVDALVGSLTGDVGAARRAGKTLSRRARSQLRSVGRPNTCYYQWEQTILWAYMELEECFYSGAFFPMWCNLRWTMQAESAWFHFLACSGLGLIR
jgi:hypothetical protein